MLNTIAHVLNAGEETAAQEALEMFIEVQYAWHFVSPDQCMGCGCSNVRLPGDFRGA